MKQVQIRPGVFVAISDQTSAKARKAFAEVSLTRAQVLNNMARMDDKMGRVTAMAGPLRERNKRPLLKAA